MKYMKTIVVAGLLMLIGGCGKPPQAIITLKGETPLFGDTAHRNQEGFVADTRKIEYICPVCRHPIGFKKSRCKCEAEVSWPKSIYCKYCSGTGTCPACVGRQKVPANGKCPYCKGNKYNFWGEDCVNCLGKGDCPTCGGTGKCDYCEGKGRISLDRIQQLISRPAYIQHEEKKKEGDEKPSDDKPSGEAEPKKEGEEPPKKEAEEPKKDEE